MKSRRSFLTQISRLGAMLALAPIPAFAAVKGKSKTASGPKYRGVVYDVGLNFSGDATKIKPFDPALAEHDIRVIANDLHANAVRIEGEDIGRLVAATRAAHAVGLSVFFNPWKMNVSSEEVVPYMAEAAAAAEKLRMDGVDIVFVAGCEYTLFNRGVYPGDSIRERIDHLIAGQAKAQASPSDARSEPSDPFPKETAQLNKILKSIVDVIRPSFRGPVSYAAGMWERVDWSIFDIVGLDHYRAGETDEAYIAALAPYQRLGKPVVVMEVGSCAYVGAAKVGAGGFLILEGRNPDGTGKWKDGVVPTRSEKEQADYVEQQVTTLSNAGMTGVFVYVFAQEEMTAGEGAMDFDMAGFSLVKTFPEDDPRSKQMPPWAPKQSFYRLSSLFRRHSQNLSR